MRPLIISRKTANGKGGLNRFYVELSRQFPTALTISPDSLLNLTKLPKYRPTHVYLCDATLLPIGVFFKFLFKKPLIVTAHGLDIIFKNSLYQGMVNNFLPRADKVVLDSLPTRKLLRNFNQSLVKVIPPGVTTSHILKSEKIPLPDMSKKIILTTVGNLVERKGHNWFIKNVLQKLPEDFIYFIVGKGSQEKLIKKTINNLKLNKRVFIFGQLSHPQLSFIFKKTDIYVSPNQHIDGNFESFGIAALEAAALGIPVIASNIDGISQAIHSGRNGLLVDPSSRAFVQALIRLREPLQRQRLGNKAKMYTQKKFNWTKTAKVYAKVFADAGRKQAF